METIDQYMERVLREERKKLRPWDPDYAAVLPAPPEPKKPWAAWSTSAICSAKKRARIKKWKFDLTSGWVRKRLEEQGYRCALSGIEFSEKKVSNSWKRPWRPSLDRIDASRGYTKDNVRIVCVAVNTLLHDWGDAVFHEIISASRP